jgi:hypothetical protein
MSRLLTRTRNRTLFAGVAMAVSASSLGLAYNPAQAVTSYGANRVARAERLAAELAAFTEAAKTCDLDTTREAYEKLESVWNAVEIDVQFASVERYNFFEHVYLENRVAEGTGLEGAPVESCETMVALAQGQATTWNEVIEFFRNSAENSPAFNDVATLRTVNQGIRLARTALAGYPEAVPPSPMTAPDLAGAKAHWQEFLADYPAARPIIAFRNEDLATEIDGLVANVTAAFKGTDVTAISNALTALAPRYNLGATLVTAAGRGHVAVRPTFNPQDFYTQGTLGDIVTALEEMRSAVELGTPEGAAAAQATYLEKVQLSLSFKTGGPLTHADVALTNAVNNYVTAQTPANAKALLDQIAVAEQLFVGQYWGTPELDAFLETL